MSNIFVKRKAKKSFKNLVYNISWNKQIKEIWFNNSLKNNFNYYKKLNKKLFKNKSIIKRINIIYSN